jgi:hypothetical protein
MSNLYIGDLSGDLLISRVSFFDMLTELDKTRLDELRVTLSTVDGMGPFIETKKVICGHWRPTDEDYGEDDRKDLWCVMDDISGQKHKFSELDSVITFFGVNNEIRIWGDIPGFVLKPSTMTRNPAISCALQDIPPDPILEGMVDPDRRIRSLFCIGSGL